MERRTRGIEGIRILSLEDNVMDKEILAGLLSGTGVVIDSVSSADDAYKMIESNSYDLLLIDHMMPGVDGITTLRIMRERHLCDNTPAIAVTGNNLSSAKTNYIESGFSEYITKPLDKQKLLDAMIRCLFGTQNDNDEDERNTILVVDDNQMNLLLAKKILSSTYDVTVLSSAKAALRYLEETIPDMILLDLHMPEMDGFQFLETLKADERYMDIPVICLTADEGFDSELKCFDLGALDFIKKPFVAEIMRRRVACILELSILQKDLQTEVEKKTRMLNNYSLKLERITDEVMLALASAIDAKDKYTNGHSVRVAEYSKLIAERLNMSEREQNHIYRIGLLHDVGKIGIPDEIINKTKRLTDDEYAKIKTHPTIGAEILGNMSELPDIVVGAKYHHERYDGMGYPEGLSGENIPLVARIIAVADAYDAMTSNRSYREGLPQQVVRNEMIKGKGTQFDPVFAGIMLNIIDDDTNYDLREKK